MTNHPKPNRPRYQLRIGSPIFKQDLLALEMRLGYSQGHIRRLLKGEQVGEPFMAAVVYAFGGRVEDYFELINPIAGSGAGQRHVSVNYALAPEGPTGRDHYDMGTVEVGPMKPEGVPTSWNEAIADFGLIPEEGPPLFNGADTNQPDRVVFLQNTIPVLAFEQDGTIRTYAATKLSDKALAVLAWHGHTEWTGNALPSRDTGEEETS